MDLALQPRMPATGRRLYLTAAALAISLAALVVGTVLFSRQADENSLRAALQADLSNRLRMLQTVLVSLSDAETGQRGYLLTGHTSYLAPYHAALERLPVQLKGLDGIPLSDAQLSARAAQAHEAIRLKLTELQETLRVHEAGSPEEALAMVRTDAGARYMDQARSNIHAVLDTIRAERDRLNLAVAEGSAQSRRLATWSVAALVVFVLLSGVQIVQLLVGQRRYQKALAASEAQHRGLIEEQAELVSLARADGTLVYLNPAYPRIFLLSTEEMVGTSLYAYVAPADREIVRERIAQIMATDQVSFGENRMVTPDGTEKWLAWTNQVRLAPDGERLLHSVGRDITERKQAEAALQASEDFLARTGRVAGVGGWELDLHTLQVRWSDGMRRIHDVAPDYQPTLDSVLSFYEPGAARLLQEAMLGKGSQPHAFDLELELVTASGRRRCVRAVGEAEYEEHGEPRRLVGALQDITERKALEQRLADSERFVREITDNLPLRISYVDAEGRYRFVNLRQCERFGRPREEIIGRTREELLGGPDAPAVTAAFRAAIQGQPQRFEFETEVDGQPRLIENQLIPDRAGDGRIKGVFTIGIDITERKATERALRDITDIFDHTTDFVVQTDWRGQLQYMNPAARRARGLAPDAAVQGDDYQQFNTEETLRRHRDEIMPIVQRDGVWLGETTVLGQGGRIVPVDHMVIAHRDALGRVARYSAVMRDISAEVQARQHLQLQTSILHSIAETIPAVIAVVGSDGCYRFANRAFELWCGRPREMIVGRSLQEVLGDDDYQRSLPWVQRVLAGETVSFEKEYAGKAHNRHMAISFIPLRVDGGAVEGFVAMAQDITEHREEAQRLLVLSERDALTGVLNRAGFERYLQHKVQDGDAAALALLYIDLDRFKPINDTHGHPVGDEVLRQFAVRLQAAVRPTDAVARLGGDEFAIVLSGVREKAHADTVADKVVEAAHAPFYTGALKLEIGASVGVAQGAGDGEGWLGLVARADAMVYRAKAEGRGRRA
ncbi:MAG: PAS domain S-box protein [Pseudomonadota bacterium]